MSLPGPSMRGPSSWVPTSQFEAMQIPDNDFRMGPLLPNSLPTVFGRVKPEGHEFEKRRRRRESHNAGTMLVIEIAVLL